MDGLIADAGRKGGEMTYRIAPVSVTALAVALLSSPAAAQEVRGPESPHQTTNAPSPASTAEVIPSDAASSSDQQNGLSEIIVTARRVEENLQNVPVAVTAFSGQELQRQSAVRVTDVAQLTPGLYAKEGASAQSAPVFEIR